MAAKKYRKKPVVITAEQWWPGRAIEGVERIVCVGTVESGPPITKHVIVTLEGEMEVSPGDYVITGVKGEKYPCKPDIFEATYDEVSNA